MSSLCQDKCLKILLMLLRLRGGLHEVDDREARVDIREGHHVLVSLQRFDLHRSPEVGYNQLANMGVFCGRFLRE